jgi:hypothetical protein
MRSTAHMAAERAKGQPKGQTTWITWGAHTMQEAVQALPPAISVSELLLPWVGGAVLGLVELHQLGIAGVSNNCCHALERLQLVGELGT